MPRPCLLGRHLGCCCCPWEAGRWNLPGSHRAAGPPRERPERKAGLSSSGVPSTPSLRSRPAEREGWQGPAAVSTHGAVKGRSGPKAARGRAARTVVTVADKALSLLLACPLPAAQWCSESSLHVALPTPASCPRPLPRLKEACTSGLTLPQAGTGAWLRRKASPAPLPAGLPGANPLPAPCPPPPRALLPFSV